MKIFNIKNLGMYNKLKKHKLLKLLNNLHKFKIKKYNKIIKEKISEKIKDKYKERIFKDYNKIIKDKIIKDKIISNINHKLINKLIKIFKKIN